jgi:hypothetical protein
LREESEILSVKSIEEVCKELLVKKINSKIYVLKNLIIFDKENYTLNLFLFFQGVKAIFILEIVLFKLCFE